MKKNLMIILVASMLFAVIANGCGKSNNKEDVPNTEQMIEHTTEDILIENTEEVLVQESEILENNQQNIPISQEEPKQEQVQQTPVQTPASEEEVSTPTIPTPQPEPQPEVQVPVTPSPEPEVQVPVEPSPEPEIQEPAQPAPDMELPGPDSDNVFENENTNYYEENVVAVRPKYLYWNNGVLYAECYIVNGCDHTVSGIEVETLAFANNSVEIASGTFGELEGITIPPCSNIIWTFVFTEDCVITPNAHLYHLNYYSNVYYY